jgi:chromate transport protein ChrA
MRRALTFLLMFPLGSAVIVGWRIFHPAQGGALPGLLIVIFVWALVPALLMLLVDFLTDRLGAGRALRAACCAAVGSPTAVVVANAVFSLQSSVLEFLGIAVAALGFVCSLLAGPSRYS